MLEMLIPVVCMASFVTTLHAQTDPVMANNDSAPIYSIRFCDSPIDAVLNVLQQMTGKDITVDLGVQAKITLATPKVTADEGVELIARALNDQGVRLEDLDENTIRVRGVPKSEPEAKTNDLFNESLKRRADYAERRRQRTIARQPEVTPEGLPPLDVQQASENSEMPENEGVALPAMTIGEHSHKQSSENITDHIE